MKQLLPSLKALARRGHITPWRDIRAVVLPVLLSKCSWDQEGFAALETLPRKGELVSAFTPRDEAWALVEEGIKKAVGQMRKTVLRGD